MNKIFGITNCCDFFVGRRPKRDADVDAIAIADADADAVCSVGGGCG